MKFVKSNMSAAAFSANVAALLLLAVFRIPIQSVMVQVFKFSDPGKYIDGSIYVLIGTCFLFLYKLLLKHYPKMLEWLHPGSGKLDRLQLAVDGISTSMAETTTRIDEVGRKVDAMDGYMAKEFKQVHLNITGLEEKLDKMETSKEAEDRDRENLQKIRRNKMTFIAKLSPDLQRFAVYKANSFIDLVLCIHSIGFYTTDEEGMRISNPRLDAKTIEEDIYCQAAKVQREGEIIMGKEFMDLFYESHVKKVEAYVKYISSLLCAADNYKHGRFQEESEKFLSEFLEELHHTFIDFKDGKRAGSCVLFDNCRER